MYFKCSSGFYRTKMAIFAFLGLYTSLHDRFVYADEVREYDTRFVTDPIANALSRDSGYIAPELADRLALLEESVFALLRALDEPSLSAEDRVNFLNLALTYAPWADHDQSAYALDVDDLDDYMPRYSVGEGLDALLEKIVAHPSVTQFLLNGARPTNVSSAEYFDILQKRAEALAGRQDMGEPLEDDRERVNVRIRLSNSLVNEDVLAVFSKHKKRPRTIDNARSITVGQNLTLVVDLIAALGENDKDSLIRNQIDDQRMLEGVNCALAEKTGRLVVLSEVVDKPKFKEILLRHQHQLRQDSSGNITLRLEDDRQILDELLNDEELTNDRDVAGFLRNVKRSLLTYTENKITQLEVLGQEQRTLTLKDHVVLVPVDHITDELEELHVLHGRGEFQRDASQNLLVPINGDSELFVDVLARISNQGVRHKIERDYFVSLEKNDGNFEDLLDLRHDRAQQIGRTSHLEDVQRKADVDLGLVSLALDDTPHLENIESEKERLTRRLESQDEGYERTKGFTYGDYWRARHLEGKDTGITDEFERDLFLKDRIVKKAAELISTFYDINIEIEADKSRKHKYILTFSDEEKTNKSPDRAVINLSSKIGHSGSATFTLSQSNALLDGTEKNAAIYIAKRDNDTNEGMSYQRMKTVFHEAGHLLSYVLADLPDGRAEFADPMLKELISSLFEKYLNDPDFIVSLAKEDSSGQSVLSRSDAEKIIARSDVAPHLNAAYKREQVQLDHWLHGADAHADSSISLLEHARKMLDDSSPFDAPLGGKRGVHLTKMPHPFSSNYAGNLVTYLSGDGLARDLWHNAGLREEFSIGSPGKGHKKVRDIIRRHFLMPQAAKPIRDLARGSNHP